MTNREHDPSRLAELTRDIAVAMVTTVDAEGHFTACPMAHREVEPDGTLWFFAESGSSIVDNLKRNAHVGVALSSSSTWVSINGTAEVLEDPETKQALWDQVVEAWLPQGPDDPGVVLIKVTGHTAEYWDTPGGRVASVISFVKSKLTGERFEGTRNVTMDLSD